MLSGIEKFAKNSAIVRSIFNTYRYNIQSDKDFIVSTFKRRLGYAPDLKNPRTLNEKIQWLKLNHHSQLHTTCSDKIEVKKYVMPLIGEKHIIRTMYFGSDPNGITRDILSERACIIKTSHGSGGGIVIREPQDIDIARIRENISGQLKKNFYKIGREPQYREIEPRFLVEELLTRPDGSVPYDFKIHCFNGEPEFIQVDIDRFSNHRRNIYTTKWESLPFEWQYPRGVEQEKPPSLGTMIDISRVLSKPFTYSRIDLYDLSGDVFFGEITFHPGSGWERFSPESWDKVLGDKLDLSRPY